MAPEDLRAEPSLAAIKTVQDLAKGYVSAQKLIGAKRTAIPGDNATDAQWGEFFNAVGRPDSPDKYEVPDVKVDDSLKPNADRLKLVQKKMHDLGFTPKQARGIMEYYMTSMNEQFLASKAATETQSSAATAGLKQEWGEKFDTNVDIAKGVIRKFAGADGDAFLTYLDQSGMGSNVQLIKFLHKVGSAVLEDKDRGNSGANNLPLNDQSRATIEIESMKGDEEFQKALQDARHPAHKSAVDRWIKTHSAAHPGKAAE